MATPANRLLRDGSEFAANCRSGAAARADPARNPPATHRQGLSRDRRGGLFGVIEARLRNSGTRCKAFVTRRELESQGYLKPLGHARGRILTDGNSGASGSTSSIRASLCHRNRDEKSTALVASAKYAEVVDPLLWCMVLNSNGNTLEVFWIPRI